jgi:phosphatidylglycerol:prolipoprotein diacylglycerol transferase
LSSFGGLFAGALGAYVFTRHRGLAVLPWLDVLARAFSLAYVFGRAGCSLAHDHPGLPTDFFLAVIYPARNGFPAGPRHDLGFYEFLLWVLIFLVFHWLSRRRRPGGFYIGLMIVWYAPVRFGLDFLRTADLSYLGLTFAQWSCLLVFPVGVRILVKAFQSRNGSAGSRGAVPGPD